MINILIPLGGKSTFFDAEEYPFPKPLIEIHGKLMIELLLESFSNIEEEHSFIFIVQQEDCRKYHLDNTLRLLTDGKCDIVVLNHLAQGAACSALMAIDYIDSSNKLVISNGDQIIDGDMNHFLQYMEEKKSDAGAICFESVHPKWSYVRLDEHGSIVETAEKRPISKNAIAGFYYFKHGSDFVKSAMKSIEKDSSVDGLYYIAPTLNEMVLENKRLDVYKIENHRYHSFYSPQKIKEYEISLASREVFRADR
jgi:NDP-sugar pyrophosphorylase family protein